LQGGEGGGEEGEELVDFLEKGGVGGEGGREGGGVVGEDLMEIFLFDGIY